MLKLFRSASAHHGQPWAISEDAMRSILARAADEEKSFQAIAKEWGDNLDGCWDGLVHQGVAVIPVAGVLMRQLSFWGLFSGSSSYEILMKDLHTAASKAGVSAIILDFDTPGGEVTGVSELANAIHELAKRIPIIAYATGSMCSAGYWLASACTEIVVSSTSAVGSIGCIATLQDYSGALSKAGVKEYTFVSSVSPMKNADPATDEGRNALQEHVDALAEVFVSDVAKFRQVSRDEVVANYGQGGVFIGQHAVTAGLADAVGSLEELIEELATETNQTTATAPAPEVAQGANDMGLLKKVTAKAALRVKAKAKAADENLEAEDEIVDDENLEAEDENVDAEGEDLEAEDETVAEGEDLEAEDEELAEGEELDAEDEELAAEEEQPVARKAKAKAKTRATGERGRIQAILGFNASKGRRALAEHLAFETNLSPKAALGMLKAAPRATAKAPAAKAKGNGFDARMRAQGNPKVGTAGKSAPATGTLATARLLGFAK